MPKRLVFDVESVGLHGEAFAVGYVVLNSDGVEIGSGAAACPITTALGSDEDRAWVTENVSLAGCWMLDKPIAVRDWFWPIVQDVKASGGEVWTDCGWPVEANFLSACIADDPEARRWAGPYPLLDVANVLLVAGMDPLGTYPRHANELPAHNALNDARQSARMLREALGRIGTPATA